MNYTVKYKRPGALFWRTIKDVEGDLVFCDDRPGGSNMALPVRVLILRDKTRIELPLTSVMLKFSPARFYDTVRRVEAETGQDVKIKP